MKKIVLLAGLILLVLLWVNRQRVYLWDPVATVTRDGVKQEHVRTMINGSSDIFLDDQSKAPARMYVVQQWNMKVDYPTGIKGCIQYLACLADADHATGMPIAAGPRGKRVPAEGVLRETNKWEFVDETGALVVVTLR